jgi:hypothetical protein
MKKVSEDIPGYTGLAAPHRDGPSASPLRRNVELRQRSGLSCWSDPHRRFGPGTRAIDVLEHGVPGTAMRSCLKRAARHRMRNLNEQRIDRN